MHYNTKDAKKFVDSISRYIKEDKVSERELPKVNAIFEKLTAQAMRERSAKIVSAINLTNDETENIKAFLSRFVGHSVDIELTVSNKTLGGLRIQMGDWVFDSTLLSQVQVLSKELLL